jgi:hypothetical protein
MSERFAPNIPLALILRPFSSMILPSCVSLTRGVGHEASNAA